MSRAYSGLRNPVDYAENPVSPPVYRSNGTVLWGMTARTGEADGIWDTRCHGAGLVTTLDLPGGTGRPEHPAEGG